jgi:hypothetical protein
LFPVLVDMCRTAMMCQGRGGGRQERNAGCSTSGTFVELLIYCGYLQNTSSESPKPHVDGRQLNSSEFYCFAFSLPPPVRKLCPPNLSNAKSCYLQSPTLLYLSRLLESMQESIRPYQACTAHAFGRESCPKTSSQHFQYSKFIESSSEQL